MPNGDGLNGLNFLRLSFRNCLSGVITAMIIYLFFLPKPKCMNFHTFTFKLYLNCLETRKTDQKMQSLIPRHMRIEGLNEANRFQIFGIVFYPSLS